MSGTHRKGKVFVQNRYAGNISETDEGYEFSYDEKYKKLIKESFITEEMKEAMLTILDDRMERLKG